MAAPADAVQYADLIRDTPLLRSFVPQSARLTSTLMLVVRHQREFPLYGRINTLTVAEWREAYVAADALSDAEYEALCERLLRVRSRELSALMCRERRVRGEAAGLAPPYPKLTANEGETKKSWFRSACTYLAYAHELRLVPAGDFPPLPPVGPVVFRRLYVDAAVAEKEAAATARGGVIVAANAASAVAASDDDVVVDASAAVASARRVVPPAELRE